MTVLTGKVLGLCNGLCRILFLLIYMLDHIENIQIFCIFLASKVELELAV